MREDAHAEIGERALRDQHREVILRVEEPALADDSADVEEADQRQAVRVADRDVAVDRDLQEIRLHQHQPGADRQTHDREPEEIAVRLDEGPQTPHQPRVVRLPERLLLVRIVRRLGGAGARRANESEAARTAHGRLRRVRGAHSASSSSESRWRWKRSA